MKKAIIRGLRSMANGRGPFIGSVRLVENKEKTKSASVSKVNVILGQDRMHRRLGDMPYIVVVGDPKVGWFHSFKCPIEAETCGRLISGMRVITERQLAAVGFYEDRRVGKAGG